MAEKEVKVRYKKSDKVKLKKDGTVSKHCGKPMKFSSPDEMEEKINEYWDWAKEKELHYTMTGLAAYLDIDYQTLLNYAECDKNGWLSSRTEEERKAYVELIKRAKRFMVMYYEERLYDRSSATGGIFALKNLWGWKDRQEVVTTTDNNINVDLEDVNKELEELE